MSIISIVMPYRQKRDYIHKSVKSVLRQTYKKFELIILYDDSNLNDLDLLKKIAAKDKRIKLIINKKNIGAGLSRNKGINISKGKYIAFLDSDDTWHKNKLKKQINFIKKNNYKFIFCSYLIKKRNMTKLRLAKKFISYKELLKSCDIGLSTVMLDRRIVPKKLFPKIKTKEDYVAWLKICKKNLIAYGQNEILTNWNDDEKSLSKSTIRKIIDAFKVYYVYEKFPLLISIFCVIRLSMNYLKKKYIL
jgi:teichuronic acid biosynthesis glycosyltransferase TuaG